MFSIETLTKVNNIALFSFQQVKISSRQKIVSYFCDGDESVVVFFDDDLLIGKTMEVRGDGIWSDVIQEVKDEHWSLSMESFALRMTQDEFTAQALHQDLVGERIPYGYDLDCTNEDGAWKLSGSVIVGRTVFEVSEETLSISF